MAIVGVLLAAAGVLGAQVDLLGPLPAFGVFGIGLLALLIAIVVLLIGLLLSKGTGGAMPTVRAWGAVGAALVALVVIFSQRPGYESGPPIHDLTTDVNDPPAFEAIAPLRADARNPVAYAGPETAAQQQAAFPDLKTLMIEKPTDQVFSAAEQIAGGMGWEIVAVDGDNGIIEATDTTRWFHFKDDIVIRIKAAGDGTAVDVRSKSRVGQGDMGTNTQRIRIFLTRLSETTASG